MDGDLDIATVTVTITEKPNYIPNAHDDERGTTVNISVNINVLLNDTGLDDGGISLSILTAPHPAEGSATVNGTNNTIDFTPATDFTGDVVFEYEVCDADGDCDSAHVVVHVKNENFVPFAVNDSVSVWMNNDVNINVLANDYNLDDGLNEVTIYTNPVNGSAVVYGDNSINYTPSNWYIGLDSMLYMVEDADGDIDTALVYIEIKAPVNHIPVAVDDSRGTSKNTNVIVDVLFNDKGLEDGGLIVTVDNTPTNGSVVVNGDNTVTYTPDVDYIGTDNFEYHFCDGDGDCSATATVTIIVKEVNILPEAVDDNATTYMDTPVTINVLDNDTKLYDGIKSLNIHTNPSNGSVVINPDRTVTYTPYNWYLGTDQFKYWVEDVDGDYSIATVTIKVIEEPNHMPVANDDSRGTSVNTDVIVDVLVNDNGLEDGGIVVTSLTTPTNGAITVNVDNTITYTPNTDYLGTDQFSYQVCDTDGDCSSATVIIIVKENNVVPMAADDNANVYMNIGKVIHVLTNDTGLEDGIGDLIIYSNPSNGNAVVNGDNTVTYTPAMWYVGSDSFEYQVEDVDGDYSIATVYITISKEPDYVPVAVNDSRGTILNTEVNIDVLMNDSGLEDGGLTLTVNSTPSNGSAVVEIDNTITYNPNTDYLGADQFTYQVCDLDGDCATATVTIHVKETNALPVANDDNATTIINTSVIVDVLTNDTGLEDDGIFVSEYSNPFYGTIAIHANNTITYTPNNWFTGSDSFEYMVTDADGDYSVATVTVTVTDKPDYVPVANDDARGTTINTDVVVDVLVNDTGLEDGGLVLSVTKDPINGTYVINGDNTITYSPATDYAGTDNFDYEVCDSDGDCSSATVTVTVKETNYVPVANNDNGTTIMDQSVTINVIANDTGLEDGIGAVAEYSSPAHGNVVINADYSVTYTPNNWYVGLDSFTYWLEDVDGDYSIATVNITVNPKPNYIPVATDDARGTSINTDVTVDVLVNDSGLEDGGIVVSVISGPTNGSVTVNGDNTITYSPDTDYTGTDQFDYQVCDTDGDCATATVTITVKESNVVPVAIDDDLTTYLNTSETIDVLANDAGLDDGGISVTIFSDPSHGSIIVNGDLSITYTPDSWYLGDDSFEYMVSDVDGDYSIARVSVTVSSEPDHQPVANDDARGTSINADVTVDVLINDTGLGDGGIVVSSGTNPSNGTITVNGDNTITYSPDNDYIGTDQFDYQLCDANGDCDQATVVITVREENNVPVAVDDKIFTNVETDVTVPVLENDSGLEDGGIQISVNAESANGTLTVNGDNTITYSPNISFEGVDTFRYMVTDADGDYDIADVVVYVMSGTLPGITFSDISGNTKEDGTKATFTVVLKTQPTENVNIDFSSDDLTEGVLSENRLTFSSLNWDTEQTVTITGQDDEIDDGDITYTIISDKVVSSDPIYSNLEINNISITNVDDDDAGITLIEGTNQTSEYGDSTSFMLVLNSEPTADVNIELVSTDLTEGMLDVINVVFSSENWSDTVTVLVTGQDDNEVDGDITFSIELMESESEDPNYDGIDLNDLSILN